VFFLNCKHPAGWLGVEKDETTEHQDADFDVTTYHLLCRKCGEPVSIKYAKMVGGPLAFLARQPVKKL
jgi:hypothetical protein